MIHPHTHTPADLTAKFLVKLGELAAYWFSSTRCSERNGTFVVKCCMYFSLLL